MEETPKAVIRDDLEDSNYFITRVCALHHLCQIPDEAFSPHNRFMITNPDSQCTFSWELRFTHIY